MAKRNTIFKKGRYYHVYNRGANQNKVFFEKANYLFLLKRVKEYAGKYNVAVIAYCLMPNHYHFILRQDGDISINIFVAHIFNSYTKAINKKYERTGTLFEGAFKAIWIEDDKYLIELCRYVHKNPLEGNLISNITDWEFSNYHEWINRRNGSLFDAKTRDRFFPEGEGYENYVLNPYS